MHSINVISLGFLCKQCHELFLLLFEIYGLCTFAHAAWRICTKSKEITKNIRCFFFLLQSSSFKFTIGSSGWSRRFLIIIKLCIILPCDIDWFLRLHGSNPADLLDRWCCCLSLSYFLFKAWSLFLNISNRWHQLSWWSNVFGRGALNVYETTSWTGCCADSVLCLYIVHKGLTWLLYFLWHLNWCTYHFLWWRNRILDKLFFNCESTNYHWHFFVIFT